VLQSKFKAAIISSNQFPKH